MPDGEHYSESVATTPIPDVLFLNPRISPLAKALFVYLKIQANGRKAPYRIDGPTAAYHMGLSEHTVRKYLKQLDEAELIDLAYYPLEYWFVPYTLTEWVG